MSIAWAFQKDSPYIELFNFYIGIAVESGAVDKMLKEAKSKGRLKSKTCELEGASGNDGGGQYTRITLPNIFSAFVILLGGMGKFYTLQRLYRKNYYIKDNFEKKLYRDLFILHINLVIAVLSLYVEKNSFAEWLVQETKGDVPLYQAAKPSKISDHFR